MIFEVLVTGLANLLSKRFGSTESQTLINDGEGKVAAGLREIATSISNLSESTQNVANAIIDVKRNKDALEAEGYVELAGKSLKAHVLDEAKKYLDKAQALDSTNWALWFGYVNWRVIQLLSSKKGQTPLSNEDTITLEKALRFVNSTDDITPQQKVLAIFTLFGVSLLYAAPTAINLAMHTLESRIKEVPNEKFQDYLPIVRACGRIPICQQSSLGEILHERARHWFEKEIDDALRHVDFYLEYYKVSEQAEAAIERIDNALELGAGIISDTDAERARICRNLTEQCELVYSTHDSIENPGCLTVISLHIFMISLAGLQYFNLLNIVSLTGLILVALTLVLMDYSRRKKIRLSIEYDAKDKFYKLRDKWAETCGRRKSGNID